MLAKSRYDNLSGTYDKASILALEELLGHQGVTTTQQYAHLMKHLGKKTDVIILLYVSCQLLP
jgi:hypothetical protein